MRARRRRELRDRIIRYLVISGLAVAAIWFLFLRGAVPDEIGGHDIEHFSTAGSGDHTESDVDYETNPPVSGAHSQRTAPCGTFAEQIPDNLLVHNLEHGVVAILFQPTLPHEELDAIQAIAQDYESHVLSAPDADMETPIAVAAWGHRMDLDQLDEDAVGEFIEVFRQGGDAPEANQECDNTSDQHFGHDPTAPTGSPSPGDAASPEPSPSR